MSEKIRQGFARTAVRHFTRIFAWSLGTVYFASILAVLSLRYWVLPHIEDYRAVIERAIGEGIGQAVRIGRAEASWAGFYPDLILYDVSVADAEGRPALAFSRIETELSWRSVIDARLRLTRLRIDEPTLHMRRGGDGRFFIAGIPLARGGGAKEGGGGGGISAWALDQRRIRIDGATLIWEDELRGAPPLVMEDVNIAIDNDGERHRFGLTALLPGEFASRMDVRGDFTSRFDAPGAWSGQVFAEIGYADLAIWKRWVDYPFVLPHGRGALRAWLNFDGGAPRELTADVALRDVNLKLGEALPALELESLSGRVQAGFPGNGLALKGRGLALVSRAALDSGDERPMRVDPTDFELEWRKDPESGKNAGSAGITRMDVEALARLAAYLPFDARWRQLLEDYAPRGEIEALEVRWSGGREKIDDYYLRTGVRGLGLRARGYFPGFSGITGALEASESGGRAVIDSGESSIDLPAVFPESLTRLDALNAEASWTIGGDGLEVELARVEFAGPEAAGSAQGKYRTAGEGPGFIDLTAALTRADARAVWRYMPHVVSPNARRWLRDSLLGGKAAARLVLKGELKDFPFSEDDDPGQFLVTVEAGDVILDYAKGWPRIDGIAGDLAFQGSGMTVDARQGRILGTRLARTRVRIPDFDAAEPILLVRGQVNGPTAEFLKFIDQSPVAEKIDYFTEGMRAAGNGTLDLDLAIPLDGEKLDRSKVAGVYRFADNEVTVDAALPPLREVNGRLHFSGDDLTVPEIGASLFGGPLKIRGGLQKGGGVLITADGSVDIDRLRRQSGHPLLERLSGETAYRSEIRILGRNADLLVESDLAGLSSTLPEPFAKTADETQPLRFEKRLLPADKTKKEAIVRDRLSLLLENFLEARVIRRKTPGGFVPERGAVAVGRPLRVPEAGLALDVSARHLDLDAWLELFDAASSGDTGEAAAWRPGAIDLRADALLARGMTWNDVNLSAALARTPWRIRVDSRQMKGDIMWDEADGGRLIARLARLAVERLPPPAATETPEAARRLPALDVIAENFSVGRLDFGRLRVRANNDGAAWKLSQIEASNPHGALTGQGVWQPGEGGGGGGQTRLRFELDSGDVGGLLARLGYPGTVQGGTARLGGELAWDGAPAEIDFASIHGAMELGAVKGQFLKLDPGAAGKLLGLISLQNLPRRISLDFKDVFSEGLAFDAIGGSMTVRNGIMHTRQLRIDSPSAQVSMRGEVDLSRETQHLEVTVQPEVGDTAAVGMAIVHPAAGVATWLANKVLKNPLGTVFSYRYLISGAWDDPKIEKLAAPAGETFAPVENRNYPEEDR
ncbi:MAG: TIGR02099 family protein [Candidatus Accumulibacter sp.]|jgi:uncharacterized protein (TIGR02099 family)|nr:TIGR02099 family protein [Accumulibacter sp.]